ncbi:MULTISPECIES: hypothetical protein [unclassified Frankia]|uniref:hypothetical protein n=1 Tax=unclassified Frankia TaxID=2632575 RepID=UPI001EF56195|nr:MULTISPECIES: hypothetical protein [unclassified Frankia]
MSTPAPIRPDTARLDDLSVRLLSAMLDSASVDVIGVASWWDRARTALETGAAAAVDYPSMVSAIARKLQITGALYPDAARTVSEIGAELNANPGLLPALRGHCRRNAVYVVALARIQREKRKAEKKAAHTPAAPTAITEEIVF